MSLAVCLLLYVPPPAAGQAPAGSHVNPQTIEFDPPDESAGVTGYRVELFVKGSDTATAPPVRFLDVKRPRGRDRRLRVDLREWLQGVSDGEYVATVRSLSRHGESARSEPTEPFTISGLGGPVQSRPAPAPVPVPVPAPAQPDSEPDGEPWPWTLVGIAMGVAALLAGFLFR